MVKVNRRNWGMGTKGTKQVFDNREKGRGTLFKISVLVHVWGLWAKLARNVIA